MPSIIETVEANYWTGFLAEGILLACRPINIAEVFKEMRPNEAERPEGNGDKRGVALALPDSTIAAAAITNGLHSATDNPNDFPVSGLRLYPLPRVGGVKRSAAPQRSFAKTGQGLGYCRPGL